MSPDVFEGIRVTVLGMLLEFIILGVVLVSMVVLERVFRPREEKEPASADSVSGNLAAAKDE